MNTTTLTNIADELSNLGKQLRVITVKVRSSYFTGGSGVIWQSSPLFPGSLIITNAHVAFNRRAIVELADGRVLTAVRTKIAPELDLAALTIAATNLPTATIGNADGLRVGELVLAVGNPFADKGAVTTGIVSAKNERLLMADIQLFPGNSGGLLANCLGHVVGINTMIVNGLGVAIPSSTVERFLCGEIHPQPDAKNPMEKR
ncbi:trypsin-like peptidase domain-containing protein [Chlorogloeopsis sp. ULAP01]|uniref:S1C family serine protease n=1 Tax=Chlorogloeopsis sp. ULAP01 TaxID=3056483 RepID=UPI0025AAA771|nr:trypsin-like peptidase domain-containing protein [Chlorogloeopsis sp. ULAP01]MDM9379671.1 trypsin-like peptidase domain-containing protein [Chlorogloeopsis sp. ULAP01]